MEFTRYAIFFTPAPGPLADFGAAWLGWDARSGTCPPAPDITLPALARDDITGTPRKYGFHGTIAPPFVARAGLDQDALETALAAFCADQGPVQTTRMELARLGRFLALVPAGQSRRITQLAARVLQHFDELRTAPTAPELARRRQARLSARQDALLRRWGYPYVMEEFRFHMTLSAKLPKAKATELHGLLAPRLAPLLPAPFCLDALSLMGERPDGMFRILRRIPLTGTG